MGTHAGVHTGEDGESAQCVEDTTVFTSLHGFSVVAPADSVEAESATQVLAALRSPSYQRVGRNPVPIIHDTSFRFILGKWETRREGGDVTLMAHGALVAICERAAELLEGRDISARVINASTLKPVDRGAILAAGRETRGILVAADEGPGGLYAAVTGVLAKEHPTFVDFVGVEGLGETGSPDQLYTKHGFTPESVANRAAALATRRK
jgi:transketolase